MVFIYACFEPSVLNVMLWHVQYQACAWTIGCHLSIFVIPFVNW